MKKYLYLILACVLCSVLVFTACSSDSTEQTDVATETEAVEAEVTQADIEENIIGKWILSDRDGQPVTTNEKIVYTFESDSKVLISESINSHEEV